MPTPSPSGSALASLFAAWLEELSAGGPRDIEALCQEHIDLAPALRELYGHWLQLEQVMRQFGLGRSLTDKLQSRYGKDVDPKVSLEAEEPTDSDGPSEVLSRLGSRGPASSRYHIQGEVAHGGMGAVLRVWDMDLRRHLAMKVMLGRGGLREEAQAEQVNWSLLARFLEEAQVTGQLDHPGIVPVHELGLNAEGRIYFTMKLVKGQTLEKVFDELARGEGQWTQIRVLGLILKVCEAMSYAHAKGVIHRDLKPANVMVGKFGEVYVMDWGLAKILGRDDGKDIRIREEPVLAASAVQSVRSDRLGQNPDSPLYTMDGDVVGTPAYMSPEQALGQVSEMGPPSDVYAVGAMLYHLLAGHMPFAARGARLNNYAILAQVQAGPPRSLEDLAPRAPVELVAICEKAMARDKAARYASTKELGEDLAAYVEGRVVRAYETGAWAEARKWVRRNKPLAATLAAAVVLLVVGLVSSLLLKAQSDANADRADAKSKEATDNLTLAQKNEHKALDNLKLAQSNEAMAKAQQLRAEAETAKVLRLSDVKLLQELNVEADTLWPAHPEVIGRLESWVERARQLTGNLSVHRATLAEMRARSRPWSPAERERDRSTHPKLGELASKQSELQGLIAQMEGGLNGDARDAADERIAVLDREVTDLTEQVEARRTWTFDSPEDQWQHDVLSELIANLELLSSGLLAADRITPQHGWSVPKRLAFAKELEAGFGSGGQYAQAWADALPAIREVYPGVDLKPQMGLVPLGPDPTSGLWEFAHLMTGTPAERRSDGKLALTEQMGVVLVLLRGGTFWMGAQSDHPDGQNHDPQARPDELPVHEVELSPFFLSKFEMTQGQWLRLTDDNPSQYTAVGWESYLLSSGQPASLLHPVEMVSWLEFKLWLERAGLALPTEAEWEYGARAGTMTPWWTGEDKESLSGAANLVDRYAYDHSQLNWIGFEMWLDDGATLHAPVGTYVPNAFGLHEVAGNLFEFCRDYYDEQFYAHCSRLNPVCEGADPEAGTYRGGAYAFTSLLARSGDRQPTPPTQSDPNLGARPARSLWP